MVVRLTPLVALKGSAPQQAFEIVSSWSFTTCGPFNRYAAGQHGGWGQGLLVVFMQGQDPSDDSITDILSIDHIVDPDAAAAVGRVSGALPR